DANDDLNLRGRAHEFALGGDDPDRNLVEIDWWHRRADPHSGWGEWLEPATDRHFKRRRFAALEQDSHLPAAFEIVGCDDGVVLAEIDLVGFDKILKRLAIILVGLLDVNLYRFYKLLPGWIVGQVKYAKRRAVDCDGEHALIGVVGRAKRCI